MLVEDSVDSFSWLPLCFPPLNGPHLSDADPAPQVAPNAPWIAEAVREGLGPLLYWRLTSLPSFIPIPEAIRHAFWAAVSETSQRTQWVPEIFRALSRAGVGAAPLKGCWLVEAVYPAAALRPYNALELLVSRPDVVKADEALRKLGFALQGQPGDLSRALETPDRCCSLEYQDGKTRASCRLQLAIASPYDWSPRGRTFPEASALLATARREHGACGVFLDLPAPVHFLHMLEGLTRPGQAFRPLIQVVDLVWVLHRFGDATVQEALDLAKVWGMDRLAGCALATAAGIVTLPVGAKAPPSRMARVAPRLAALWAHLAAGLEIAPASRLAWDLATASTSQTRSPQV